MSTEPVDTYTQAALEIAGVSAVVLDKTQQSLWCTPAYRSLVGEADSATAELIKQAVASLAGAEPQTHNRPQQSGVDLGPLGCWRIIARPLGRPGDWLVVLLGPPTPTGGDDLQADSSAGSLDPVTGLPDRAALEEHLAERFQQPGPFALLFIDLNGFKRINDTLGHLAGDRALREAATRMRRTLREDDFIARFGGDEFVAFIERVDSAEDLRPLLDRLGQSMLAPIVFEDREVGVSASIGVALSADGYASSEAMLHAADTRMYASRASAQQRSQAD